MCLRLLKCYTLPLVARSIQPELSWCTLVDCRGNPSSFNIVRSPVIVFDVSNNAAHSASAELKLADFCRLVVAATTTMPYINNVPERLRLFSLTSFAQLDSTYAVSYVHLFGLIFNAYCKIPFKVTRSSFSAHHVFPFWIVLVKRNNACCHRQIRFRTRCQER